MSQLRRKLTALVAAAFFYGGMAAPGAQALSTQSDPVLTGDAIATITAMSGTVLKRGFVDWEKEIWGEPQRAEKNDKLREGMQIGTGNNSWAEVSWPNVKTRAWSNTVFAIAPNKRMVYLTGGEMLFRLDKNRKDHDAYYIWTKVLQARIRGTTVLVQAKGPVTRFTVMEGTVEILNRLDHSSATLKPGAVYEIIGYQTNNTQQKSNSSPQPTAAPPKISNYVTDILYDRQEKCKMPLFQNPKASTNVYPSNSQALKQHPLLNAGGLIDSMPLIQEEQSNLPGSMLNIHLADAKQLTKVLETAVQIQGVPTKADYFVGPFVGGLFKLPPVAQQFPPKGMIFNPSNYYSQMPAASSMAPSASSPKVAMPMALPVLPITPPAAEAADQSAQQQLGKGVFEDVEKPLPTQDFLEQPLMQSDKPAQTPFYNENPAPSAFQTMPGSLPTATSTGAVVPTSALGAAIGATPLAPTMIMPTGIMPAGAPTNIVPTGISPTGINPGGAVSPLTTTLNNTLSNTVNTAGRTINNITSGINLR
ncbi:MAG TPA: FecR domain-containing protein [Candidatus Obscuribacterales bacterium]